ncbi:MAG: FecR domain-containing protein [Bryobacterales bacterium]|nr:FecR domain-containing protein [Bryobacterales bacterium]
MTRYATLFLLTPALFGQMAISVKSGLIHHVEGQAVMDGVAVKKKANEFPMVKEGSTFATERGTAEILLSPGSFLRLGPDSSFQMKSVKLEDARLQMLSGKAMLEVAELAKGHHIVVGVGEAGTEITQAGLYEFDVKAGVLRVFDGKAKVMVNDQVATVKGGRVFVFDRPSTDLAKFNRKKEQDGLYAWSAMRSGLLANANMLAARTLGSNGYRMSMAGWAYYPSLGFFTYLPRSGMCQNFFGYYYYSPATLIAMERPRYDGGGMGGGRGADSGFGGGGSGMATMGMGRGSGGGDFGGRGASVSAPPPAAPAAAAGGGGRAR